MERDQFGVRGARGPMYGQGQLLEFGPFRADTLSNCLFRSGETVELRPKVFQVLCTLVSHEGQFVAYDQMIQEAWDANLVSKHTVAVTVGEVKKILQEYGSWITYRDKLGYQFKVPRSEELIRRAWHCFNRHTREGLEKAIQYFHRAAEEDSSDFRAYEGASSALLHVAIWGMHPPRQAYVKFLDAHGHAVALRGLTPELRADRAHGLHIFERNLEKAETELLQARRERPELAQIQVRLATLYLSMGRFEDSGAVLDEASRCDELSPLVAATRIGLNISARRYEDALVCGRQAVELHPYHHRLRFHYARSLEMAGHLKEALEEYRHAIRVSEDLFWLRAMEGACLAKIGQEGEALSVLGELKELRTNEYVDSYPLALFYDALGMCEEAIAELQRACEDNSPWLRTLNVDPGLDALRKDPRFAQIVKQAFGRPPAHCAS